MHITNAYYSANIHTINALSWIVVRATTQRLKKATRQLENLSPRKCGTCKHGSLEHASSNLDEFAPPFVPLSLNTFTCTSCRYSIGMRPLTSIVMYGLMGIIGCFVTLSLFWMEYGDLISLPEPFFTEYLPEYYTVIDFALVCIFSVFLCVFMYNVLISTIGIMQRLKNPLSSEKNG